MYKGKRVNLRSFELTDVFEMMKYINNYSVKRALGDPFPTSNFDQEEWIKKTWKQKREGSNYYFAIEEMESKKLIGVTGLRRVNAISRSASFTIAIYDPANWNKGFGTESLKVILSVAFDLLNLHSVNLRVYEYNKGGIKSYENAGFTRTGMMRERDYSEGSYHGDVMMDILEEEYYQLVKKEPENWPKIA